MNKSGPDVCCRSSFQMNWMRTAGLLMAALILFSTQFAHAQDATIGGQGDGKSTYRNRSVVLPNENATQTSIASTVSQGFINNTSGTRNPVKIDANGNVTVAPVKGSNGQYTVALNASSVDSFLASNSLTNNCGSVSSSSSGGSSSSSGGNKSSSSKSDPKKIYVDTNGDGRADTELKEGEMKTVNGQKLNYATYVGVGGNCGTGGGKPCAISLGGAVGNNMPITDTNPNSKSKSSSSSSSSGGTTTSKLSSGSYKNSSGQTIKVDSKGNATNTSTGKTYPAGTYKATVK